MSRTVYVRSRLEKLGKPHWRGSSSTPGRIEAHVNGQGDTSMTLKIAIAQMNATVGDLAGNSASRILDLARRARAQGADVLVTPELALCGYPRGPAAATIFMPVASASWTSWPLRSTVSPVLVGHPLATNGRRTTRRRCSPTAGASPMLQAAAAELRRVRRGTLFPRAATCPAW